VLTVLMISIGRIMSAYCDDKIFSVELVGAVGNFQAMGILADSEISQRFFVKVHL
jgi:hypothetical protein